MPLDTPDPRYTEYFAELKRLIWDKWTYPSEEVGKKQSGGGEVRFVLLRDGSVRAVKIACSSSVPVLDRYIEGAIRRAQPFQPIPARIADDVLASTSTTC
jgi:TonB family protein